MARTHIYTTLLLLPLLAMLASAPPACAAPSGETTSPDASPADKQKNTPKIIRDPFWPVGYVPRVDRPSPKSENSPTKEQDIPWPPLVLKGITEVNGRYAAILEGIGIVEAGEIVTRKTNRLVYRWKINSITKNGVSHTKLDVRAVDE